MDALFILMYNLFLMINKIKEMTKDKKNVQVKVAKWDYANQRVFVEITYDGMSIDRFPYVDVFRNGLEGERIYYMTTEQAGQRMTKGMDFRWLKEEELPEGKPSKLVYTPKVVNKGWIFLDIESREHMRKMQRSLMCNVEIEDIDF